MVFTRVISKVVAYAHLKSVRLHIYLDDWLLQSLDRKQLQLDRTFMLELCALLGLIVNSPKSNLMLSPEFVFWGIYFKTVSYICHRTDGSDYWRSSIIPGM